MFIVMIDSQRKKKRSAKERDRKKITVHTLTPVVGQQKEEQKLVVDKKRYSLNMCMNAHKQ